MGMAASQARYLGLTARKTNVEYEGQQVNQARTALANISANTFNELLRLEVPVAPSTQDFTTIQYSYTDGTVKETVTQMTSLPDDPNYNYMVTHFHYSDVYSGVKSMRTNPQVSFGVKAAKGLVAKEKISYDGSQYYVDGQPASLYDPTSESQKTAYSEIVKDYPDFAKNDISEVYTYTGTDGHLYFTTIKDLSNAQAGKTDLAEYSVKEDVPSYVGNCSVLPYDSTDSNQKTALDQIKKDFPSEGIATSTNIYFWQSGGVTYFATEEDLRASATSAPDPSRPTENQDKLPQYNAQGINKKIEQTQKAFIDFDSSGRAQTIRYEDSTAAYALSTETVTDENAYNDAMNKYNYDMAVYEKKIADINAKTKKLQEEDRTLELRLRQLDTEQEALQTEMEAVKKVIDKNIESTFKTFE